MCSSVGIQPKFIIIDKSLLVTILTHCAAQPIIKHDCSRILSAQYTCTVLIKKFYFHKLKKINLESFHGKVGLKLRERFCCRACNLALGPPILSPHAIFSNNHLSISPLFLRIPVSLSLLPLFPQLLGTHCHPLSLFYLNMIIFILLYHDCLSSCSSIFFSQSGRKVKTMPGKVGMNLSPYHPHFLLLLACLIK